MIMMQSMPFEQWLFRGHLDFPPGPRDIFELPAGQIVTTEIGCNKAASHIYTREQDSIAQVHLPISMPDVVYLEEDDCVIEAYMWPFGVPSKSLITPTPVSVQMMSGMQGIIQPIAIPVFKGLTVRSRNALPTPRGKAIEKIKRPSDEAELGKEDEKSITIIDNGTPHTYLPH
ncbi:hypothetical protein EW146_g8679 [Bondarzewia mesenterica]|uniref:Uncharacterized protein n=1 Tax=Bondarzewia mesenterica TaxID=1095465 RepID=A0A4S4LEC7_9AGAM|nr:hypothetical protein EW146_g8679 [Bondarzewia mesenterica]